MNNIEIPDSAKDLMNRLLKKNPKERMKIGAVKNHEFFSDININDLLAFKIEPPFKPDIVLLKLNRTLRKSSLILN
jgi:serine/threonine protein kinase